MHKLMNRIMLEIFLLLTISARYAIAEKIYWHFSPELLTHSTPPHMVNNSLQTTSHATMPDHKQKHTLISYETAQRTINSIAVIYAFIRIYEQYQVMGKPCPLSVENQSWAVWIKNYGASFCPEIIRIYGNFLFDSSVIVCQTLVYKTVARLLILCAYGDISDLIGSIIKKSTDLAKRMVT